MILISQLIADDVDDDLDDPYGGLNDSDQFGEIKISKEEGEWILRKAKEKLDGLGYKTRIIVSEYYFDEILNVGDGTAVTVWTDGSLEVSMPSWDKYGRTYQSATIDNVDEVITKLAEHIKEINQGNLSEDVINEFLDFVGKVDRIEDKWQINEDFDEYGDISDEPDRFGNDLEQAQWFGTVLTTFM